VKENGAWLAVLVEEGSSELVVILELGQARSVKKSFQLPRLPRSGRTR
jgi:hypothetical protein